MSEATRQGLFIPHEPDPEAVWLAAGWVGPFTPPMEGDNDGKVRDATGAVVCDCAGWESRAASIAHALNFLWSGFRPVEDA